MLESTSEIVFGETKFRLEKVLETYYKLVPVEAPDWFLEKIRVLHLEEEYRKMELSVKQVATFLRAKHLHDHHTMLIEMNSKRKHEVILELLADLRKDMPNISIFEVCELLENFDINSKE